jgi:hypothetical protein
MKDKTKMALINAAIAGGIAFFSGLLAVDHITWEGVIVSLCTFGLIFLTKCRDFFGTTNTENNKKLDVFSFI